MKQTHLETSSVGYDSLSGRVSSSLLQVPYADGIRPAATRGASRFPGTMRTSNTFYDYPNAILYDHNHRDG